MRKALLAAALVLGCVAADVPAAQSGATIGARHTHRFALPPEKAAACFARNSEEHSSALMAEVRPRDGGGMEVIVRVKNGVLYATAEIERATRGSAGTITLMVRTNSRRDDLLQSLVEGC